MEEFGIKQPTTLILGMTTYLVGLGCGPMLLAPLSELYGRRIVYLVSLFVYFLFVIPACVATNFTTILVVRFFACVPVIWLLCRRADLFPGLWPVQSLFQMDRALWVISSLKNGER